ncbi:MAG: L,D-transpeptidase [Candidatus Kapaibacterium sp.]
MTMIACGGGGDKPAAETKTSGTPLREAVRENDSSAARPVANADSAKPQNNQTKLSGVAQSQFPEIKYTRMALTKTLLDSVRRRFGKTKESSDGIRAITTLNRKEFGYFRVGDTIVVPDTIIGDLRAYSVFPAHYPAADTIRKLILISNKYQSYACYEHGNLVRFAACNSGTERKATFPGRYALNWKERLRISSLNENWKLPFTFNFHLYAGNAFHQFTMPGRPVSHSCVRQFMPDAEWLFSWGEGGLRDTAGHMIPLSGTPVIIIDVFDFSRPRGGPWLELASNRENVLNLPDSPMGVEEAWIPISQVPTDARGGIPNRARYLAAEDTLRARGVIRSGVSLSASINYNAIRKAKEKRAAVGKPKPKAKETAPETPKVDAG